MKLELEITVVPGSPIANANRSKNPTADLYNLAVALSKTMNTNRAVPRGTYRVTIERVSDVKGGRPR